MNQLNPSFYGRDNEPFGSPPQNVASKEKGLSPTDLKKYRRDFFSRATRSHWYWSILVVCVILYAVFKYTGSFIVTHLFEGQQFALLNAIAQVSANQSLAYYDGVWQENLWGPVTSVLAGIILLLVSYRYIPDYSPGRVFAFVLAFLCVTKFEVFFFPPYGDHVGGSLTEGWWLYKNNFDYRGLLNETPSVLGGPKYFVFSLYPGFIALLLKLAPTTAVFLAVAHLIAFGMSAAIVTIFYRIAAKIYDHRLALWSAILLLSLPLYQSMTEMIHMDLPTLFFSMMAVWYLVEKRIGAAAVFAIISVLVKGSGCITCATVFVTALLLCLFDQQAKNKPRILFYGVLALAIALLQVYWRGKFVHVVDAKHNEVHFLIGWTVVKESTYLLVFYAVSLVGMVSLRALLGRSNLLKRLLRRLPWQTPRNDTRENACHLDKISANYYPALVMFIFASMWFALHINLSVLGPRYKLILAPALLFCVVYAVFICFSKERARQIILVTAILVAQFSSYGFLYPERLTSKYYSYGRLERSLEYRNDMKLTLKIARELKARFPGFTVGAPHVTAQMLKFPEFGYVDEPLDVMMYSMAVTYGGIKNFTGLEHINIGKTIWIGYISTFPEDFTRRFPYPIDPQDKVIDVVEVGDKKATLFMGGVALERVRRLHLLANSRAHQK